MTPSHHVVGRGIAAIALAATILASLTSCRSVGQSGEPARSMAHAPGWTDAHVHLSYESPSALDSLVAHGVVAVRDCGGDFALLARWRAEIAAGARTGPRLYLAGPVIDGPKPAARYRVTVRTPAEAERAVDSLADLGVDFLKTHSAIPPAAFFAVLRRAQARGLRVAAHLPRGVAAWTAADSGVGSIEHVAESLVQSPIYAGHATDAHSALAWWRSAAGEAMVRHLAMRGVYVTPTLVRYEATIPLAATAEVRTVRAALLPELIHLTGRLHQAGVRLLVGSDIAGPEAGGRPGASADRERELLQQAGMSRAEVAEAGSAATLARWMAGR